ncbi:MAG: alpha/beta hydrolase family protein [Micromonosporaceae bacterium]
MLQVPDDPVSLLVLGHGAGGGIEAPDLTAVRDRALARGVAVARVLQPYRVAGRRSPAPAGQLDTAWTAVVGELRSRFDRLPLITGGRSSGARVACRTAEELGAVGVICLAFPLHPPGRPERSRAEELPTAVPTLVLNGDRDPFGIPPASEEVRVDVLPGADHSLRKVAAAAGDHAADWLASHGWAR